MAVPQITFTVLNTNREAVAYFFSGDSNSNGVPDAYEQYYLGNLTNSAAADADGDGFTLAQEYANANQPGGVSWSDSAVLLVNMQFFVPTVEVLVDGSRTRFFSSSATTNSGQVLGANTHPAVGDWNGDGVPDLFVGSSNGLLHGFENTGSPIVPKLVERATNFTAWSWAWSAISSPAPALGDWSGDGKADLALGGDTNWIVLLASPGNFSGAAAPITNALTVTGSKAIPALADLNSDGYADLFVLLDDGSINLYTNSGSAQIPLNATAVRTNILGVVVPNATGLAVADTQGNGSLGVLVSDIVGHIWEFQPDGSGVYTLKSKVFAGTYDGFAHRLTISAHDFDGDGDLDVIGGFAEGGLVYLKNPAQHLVISPPSATVVAGQAATFTALNASGAVTWNLRRNASGGSINGGLYLSGAAGGCMDFIEAVDASGIRGRAYANVIGTNELASFGKAVVIAATAPTELTYFLSGGFVSFSDLFLSGLLEGLDLEQAFLLARDGMAVYQSPILDDDGNGIYQTNVDGAIAAQVQIGATHLAGKDVPVIGGVAASQTLSTGTTATLWADQNHKLAGEVNVLGDQANDGRMDGRGIHRHDGLTRNEPAKWRKDRPQFLLRCECRRTVGKQADRGQRCRMIRWGCRRRLGNTGQRGICCGDRHVRGRRLPELRLNRVEDVGERGAVEPVAREDFIGEREALGGDDQREHELFAIGPVIAGVATPGFGHGVQ